MKYRAEIDGLRALAVIPVILFHAGFKYFEGGFVGVDVFFVISGYLITTIILNDLKDGDFSLAGFYERRARRILPALIVVIGVCLPVATALMLPGEVIAFGESVISALTFIANMFFWRETGYFDTQAALKPLLHTWSLAVEEQYYIFFPLLILAVFRFDKRKIAPVIILLAILSLAFSQWSLNRRPEIAYFFLPSRAWEILVGAIAAYYALHHAGKTRLQPMIRQVLAGLGVVLVMSSILFYGKATEFPGLNAIPPVIGTALILLFAQRDTWVGQILAAKPLVGCGLISYSSYLWHQPIFAFARLAFETVSPLYYVGLIAITFVLGYLTWRFIESPFRRRGVVGKSRFKIATLGSYTAVTIFCVILFTTKGFVSFYSPENQPLASLESKKSGDYVSARFAPLQLKPFDSRPLPKVLIIGDSYAQDLVNALYESGLASEINLSTRYIRAKCGNLFVPKELVASRMPLEVVGGCRSRDSYLYDDARLRALMAESDQIWLASSWKDWQAEILPLSVKNIIAEFGKTPVVFGTKSFGSYSIRQLLDIPAGERSAFQVPVASAAYTVNETIKKSMAAVPFVDPLDLFCGQQLPDCHIFTLQGALISPDGGHLTPAGARFYGERLRGLGVLKLSTSTSHSN
ncbi:acyltransferase family protein [Pseudomonas caspiana]|uniref:acyltransferase family protein n=1 Tax=Pseudomonas caspiana TaxID=1451454 RepID=UPI0032EF4498